LGAIATRGKVKTREEQQKESGKAKKLAKVFDSQSKVLGGAKRNPREKQTKKTGREAWGTDVNT